ncbi:MAG: hypothetical protein ACREQ3_20825, partial [Candidatus Binatia bacterium]
YGGRGSYGGRGYYGRPYGRGYGGSRYDDRYDDDRYYDDRYDDDRYYRRRYEELPPPREERAASISGGRNGIKELTDKVEALTKLLEARLKEARD